MTIGTRIRSFPSKNITLNNTRRNFTRLNTDNGGLEVQGTNISFTAPATISSAGNAFPTIPVGQLIQVTGGSGQNGRVFEVVTSAAGTITVNPQQIVTESAGALIDIRTV